MITPSILLRLSAVLLSLSVALSSSSGLRSEEAIEGDCIEVTVKMETATATMADIIGNSKGYFVPMAHEYYYRRNAEALLGRSADGKAELKKMDLRFKGLGSFYTTTGFDATFRQVCSPSKAAPKAAFSCVTIGSFQGIFGSSTDMPPLELQIIWSDDAGTLLLSECIGGHRAWAAMSKVKTISKETTKLIVSELVRVGYNKSYVQNLDYN